MSYDQGGGLKSAYVNKDDIEVVEGRLVMITSIELELDVEGKIKTFFITEKTTFWRGGETNISRFKLGDTVMIRFNKNSFVERAWANLTRVQGKIQHSIENGYRIIVAGNINRGVNIVIDKQRTILACSANNNELNELAKTHLLENLQEGTFIDVIGIRLEDGSILGTLISTDELIIGQAKSEQNSDANSCIPPSQNPIKDDSVSPQFVYSYTGYATWYDCPDPITGSKGRCGTCSTSRSDQAAWPSMDLSCSGCTTSCCSCSNGCKNQVTLPCDWIISFYDYCGDRWGGAYIADCGPHQISLCSRTCGDCMGYASPIIDLTKPTFAKYYDPAYRGCFSTYVETNW